MRLIQNNYWSGNVCKTYNNSRRQGKKKKQREREENKGKFARDFFPYTSIKMKTMEINC